MKPTPFPQAVIGYDELSEFTGYPKLAMRSARHESRLPVRVVGQIGNTLVFNRQDAERLALWHPAKLSKELYTKLAAQQEPQ